MYLRNHHFDMFTVLTDRLILLQTSSTNNMDLEMNNLHWKLVLAQVS